MGLVLLRLTKAQGGEAPHPAQAPRRFPNGGAPGKAQLSSLQFQKQTEHPKSDFHGVTFAGSAAPGACQAPGAPQAGQTAPGAPVPAEIPALGYLG